VGIAAAVVVLIFTGVETSMFGKLNSNFDLA
jgi:hypothetical protein